MASISGMLLVPEEAGNTAAPGISTNCRVMKRNVRQELHQESQAAIEQMTAHREADGEALQNGVHHDAEHDQERGHQVPPDPAGAASRLAYAGREIRLADWRSRLLCDHGALLCCLRGMRPLSHIVPRQR